MPWPKWALLAALAQPNFRNKLKSPPPSPTPEKPDETEKSQPAGNSYAQILRSSSIIGGASGINYVIGLIRTKVVAVLV